MSAVGGIAKYKFYEPGAPEFADLEKKFLGEDIGKLKSAMGIEGQPLPLLWTADFIPKDAEDGTPGKTEYVVGEFNCSCVGVSKFQAVCGGDQTLADVPDEDYYDAVKLTNLMGKKAIEMLTALKGSAKEVSAAASKVLSRIEALQVAETSGLLSKEKSVSLLYKMFDP